MNNFSSKLFDEFKEILLNSKKICLLGHKNPDGDCIGSVLALRQFFINKNYEVQVIVPDVVADFLLWVDDVDQITVFNQQQSKAIEIVENADVIFAVDFNSLSRVGDLGDFVFKANATKVVLDHHREPENFTKYILVDILYSSAAQIVFDFMKALDYNSIDKKVAEYVYLGISSDTGNFMYESTDASAFEAASELLRMGIDKNKIVRGLYNNYSFDRMKLLGTVLLNFTIYLPQKQTIYSYLTKDIRQKFNYKKGDHENFVNQILNVKDTNFSVFFYENTDEIRVSMRSVGDFDVNKIARKYFMGGGHKNASGGKTLMSMKETLDYFEKNLDDMIKVAQYP